MKAEALKNLPSIDKLLNDSQFSAWNDRLSKAVRTKVLQLTVDRFRCQILAGDSFSLEELYEAIDRAFKNVAQSGMKKVINATGVVLHTNLGRAPLGKEALEALTTELEGYCSLEFNLETGERGSRTQSLEDGLSLLTQSQAAAIVNNNAAAIFLVLRAMAEGREVIISRSELVQIGGGFRIPDILQEAGAKLVEVGTTNITTLADYEKAVTASTAAILKVHHSNFVIEGHTRAPALKDLASLAEKKKIPLIVDEGSGNLEGIATELRAGSHLISFSGDKLLGGAQAGIVIGKRELIEKIRKHPLYRALRMGKTEIFVLEWLVRERISGRTSVASELVEMDAEKIRARAERLKNELTFLEGVEVVAGFSSVGGGAAPSEKLPTYLLAFPVDSVEKWSRQLLQCEVPIACLKGEGKLKFDLRTVFPNEEPLVVQNLKEVRKCLS